MLSLYIKNNNARAHIVEDIYLDERWDENIFDIDKDGSPQVEDVQLILTHKGFTYGTCAKPKGDCFFFINHSTLSIDLLDKILLDQIIRKNSLYEISEECALTPLSYIGGIERPAYLCLKTKYGR